MPNLIYRLSCLQRLFYGVSLHVTEQAIFVAEQSYYRHDDDRLRNIMKYMVLGHLEQSLEDELNDEFQT